MKTTAMLIRNGAPKAHGSWSLCRWKGDTIPTTNHATAAAAKSYAKARGWSAQRLPGCDSTKQPHQFDHFSARMKFPGRRITKSFGAWLEECERHDAWHDLPDEQRQPTLANVAAFLDDYEDFQPANP